ncbi:MAG: hypothetical protein KUF79_17410 [Candidatus Thiodiazotropha sp. (ex Ctena orbiculata)]|nr:hypothetical protein [Candidatus Thiodiazotropha taylori]
MARLAIIENGVVVNVVVAAVGAYPGAVDVTNQPGVGPGWLFDGSAFSEPQLAAVEPVVQVTTWTVREFLRLLTMAEKTAIMAAHANDPVVQTFVFTLQVAGVVHADDPDTVDGLNYMEQQGYLAGGRAAEILAS